ncbi:sporulation initiation factor Spo0A C-terminal domain-containing protein [Ruminococcus sp.]|uniref:sporulation initiation factor Spo0A C-terminal domain-containing protein n=1 Tax=Ruminococcus sp. TaxID=41978 RepID=UPI0025FF9918|nr:sporulation initiation factor Spo0A C-terminal domain-containing protein [Ruminococcus sp.]MBQ8967540.1 sporulation initiation factor Spo0A C-terminal domain-containing protein [Ruminococcus sp.]
MREKETKFMDEVIIYNEGELHYEITRILNSLCFSPKYDGFNYLREAVRIVFASDRLMTGISKTVYPLVAKRSGKTPAAVERGMRFAISRAWEISETESKLKIFGNRALDKNWVPTNGELIYSLVDRLCCEAMLDSERYL